MSVAGSTSSRGTHSRSRSRSRSPQYTTDNRYPPPLRYPSRYDAYSYRPSSSRTSMPPPTIIDDYRDRDRDRDRSLIMMRDDRYLPRSRESSRYAPYYRDDMPPPPHHYSGSSFSPKSSSCTLRRDGATSERIKDPKMTGSSSKDGKEMSSGAGSSGGGGYTPLPPRYMDWRDRERERERRYWEEDRWRDLERRSRDSYVVRDMRYDLPAYGGPPPPPPPLPPPSLAYPPPPPFGGDSYRPDRDRDRDMPPSPGGPYYDRDDRDFHRPPRGTLPMESDRYRGRLPRSWGGSGNPPGSLAIGAIKRDRERDNSSIKSPRSATSLSGSSLWAAASRSREETRSDTRREATEQQEKLNKQEDDITAETVKQQRSRSVSLERKREPPGFEPESSTREAGEITSSTEKVEEEEEEEELPKPKAELVMKEEVQPVLTTEPVSEKSAVSVSVEVKEEATEAIVEHQSTVESVVQDEKPEDQVAVVRTSEMTQQEIVERIDQIENDISMYEDMLEELRKHEEEEKRMKKEAEAAAGAEANLADIEEQEAKREEEEAKQQALQVISESSSRQKQPMTDLENLSLKASPMMRKKPQLLINQARAISDDTEELLCQKLLEENRKVAKEHSLMVGGWQGKADNPDDWSDEEKWTKPLYSRIEDYPCYKENIEKFEKIKVAVARSLKKKQRALKKKELRLKLEYKELYEQWKQRNLALDRIREHERRGGSEKSVYRSSNSRRRVDEEVEDYMDGIIFNGGPDALRFGTDGPQNPYGGPSAWTSDAARSEAELLEIIQSLESADMRNPELRAAKTTATIPDMILDAKERMRTFDDRSGLVEDPLTYYHTGPDTGDVWTQQEMAAFMESYMQYPKQFEKIAAAVGTKTPSQCVLFYYRKKTKIDFKTLVSKGRRGKGSKRRDRLAAAIRRVTGDSGTTRKTKSKGSALMTDIGEAQVSRKAKEKESERKSKELRELEEANAYWNGVNERRKSKRPLSSSSSAPTSSSTGFTTAAAATTTAVTTTDDGRDKRRLPRRKGRSPRASAAGTPSEVDQDTMDDQESGVSATAKWTEKDKEAAVEAFKVHGRNFMQVAALVGTKTEDQCRNFYHNYKRKYGPNVFDEETSEIRTEEEDAAAALVGMSAKPVSGHSRAFSTQMDEPVSIASPSSNPRRRRARTSSGKAVDDETRDEWIEAEFTSRTGRRPGRTASISNEGTKRTTYSSYWSVSERNDFLRYLEMYGRDWDKMASALKTKTATQARNFYANNEEKMQLDAIVQRFEHRQKSNTFYDAKKQHYPAVMPFPSEPTYRYFASQQQAVIQHSYSSPNYATGSPYPPPLQHHHPHAHSHSHPSSVNYQPPPQPTPSFPQQPCHPLQQPTSPPSTSEQSSSVTKVADLLNNDEPGDSSHQKSWESWFS